MKYSSMKKSKQVILSFITLKATKLKSKWRNGSDADLDLSISMSSSMHLQSAAKDVLDKGDDIYKNFRREQAQVTHYDVVGKHIYEFRRREGSSD
jgi:hypothetical protein